VKRAIEPALRVVEKVAEVPAAQWNALAADHPFLRHEVFAALHDTGCACEETGWLPQFLVLSRNGQIDGVMPLYLKSHSYGEYVFDWAWADAYERHGLTYYPKLLSAVPFSPVTGPRLLAREAETRALLLGTALELARQTSSLHVLFPPESEARAMEAAGMMLRRGVQFHWQNPGYRDFEDFLATLNHAKRKKIRQERRKAQEGGTTFRHLVGHEISHDDWVFFTRCYNRTYRAHYSTPYLNIAFFERLGAALPDNVLLVIAERDGMPFASALNVFTDNVLYGRYWGALGFLPALHFEVCYYQTMEFCIERGIRLFEGGAQGEHKLSRGFMPVETWSAHWLRHPRFADAIGEFLAREARGIEHYIDELNDRSPFKNQEQGEAP
jgi:predicted N-acyltransferase